MRIFKLKILLLSILVNVSFSIFSNVKLPGIFSDNMVLQRNITLQIWGTADKNEQVKVVFKDLDYKVKADHKGQWKIMIGPFDKGGPYDMVIAGKNKIVFKNILIGDIWICSGQSNMEWPVKSTNNAEEEISNANYSSIRLFTVGRANLPTESIDIQSDGWEVCSPLTVPDFSSVGYFFGREIIKNTDIPIGLINSSWGGTPIEEWMDKSSIMKYSKYRGQLDTLLLLAQDYDKIKKQQEETVNNWNWKVDSLDRRFLHNDTSIRTMNYDDKNWQMMEVPGYWEKTVLPDYDGIVYFRKEFELPHEFNDKEATLYLASIDDMDCTWVNGEYVGSTDVYNISRKYFVPKGVLKEGKNIIVIRVIDIYLDGGIYGLKNQVYLDFKSRQISLAGNWKYMATINYYQMPKYPNFETKWYPTSIFNGMIAPLLNFPIKGVIWYQGESNTYDSYNYRNLFSDMIKGWRERWNIGDFPFYFVQLANYQTGSLSDGDWPLLRESQLKTLTLPSTGMAVTIDIGNPNDIHPRNKQEVGRRLALLALYQNYGSRVPYSGPIYKSFIIEGDKIRITFDYVFGGLLAKDGELKWFEIAGADKKFYKAHAMIQKNQVVVWSENVINPLAVRYAWNINPDGCNLINSAGLPASPFKTNEW